MDKLAPYFKPVITISYLIVNLFKKLIFWRKGSYREESLLPITINDTNKTPSTPQFDYSSSSIVNSYSSNINSNWNLINNRNQTNQIKNEQEEEPNYFEDMNLTPSLTKQKRVLVRNNQVKEPAITYQSDRLNFDAQNSYQTELGVLNDDYDDLDAWENELTNEVNEDENLKLIRQAERERRIAEHKRIKMEKELRKAKQQKSNFMATKIS